MLIASLVQALIVWSAVSSSEGTIIGAVIGGCFLLLNTTITLFLTSRRRETRETREAVEEIELVEAERKRRAEFVGEGDADELPRPGSVQPGSDHPLA